MALYTAEHAREYLWENYQENYAKDEQPLRIELLGEIPWDGTIWWLFSIRFPDSIRIVTVGPRNGISFKVELSMAQVALLR